MYVYVYLYGYDSSSQPFSSSSSSPPLSLGSKSPKHLCGVAGCGKLFGLAKDLRTHIGKEHGWMCLTCDKVFHDAAKLRAHQITHKKENEPLVSCPIPGCSSSFVTSRSLRTHLSLTHHLGERVNGEREGEGRRVPYSIKSHSCPDCPASFSFPSKLRRHQEQVHDKRKAEEGMMQETEDSEDQGKEGGVDRLTAISTTPSVSEPALPGARSSPRRSSGEQRPRAKMLIEILTGHDSPWSRPFRMTKRRRPTILDQAEEQMRQGKRVIRKERWARKKGKEEREERKRGGEALVKVIGKENHPSSC